jgi:serine/threonine protein kinase
VALGKNRTLLMGQTPYAHEKAALDFALDALPNSDPYQVWGLFELHADEGRLYEIDLLVLGYSGLYLVEIKSRPGRYRGDHQDWYVEPTDGGRPILMENPYRLTNHKAKVLSSMLRRKLARPPWVYPLVFLSADEVTLGLSPYADNGVVTRKTLARALTHHEFPGGRLDEVRRPVNTPMMREVVAALRDLGLKESQGARMVGQYELTELLDDGDNYQEWAGRHRATASLQVRARIYLVPKQADVEQRRSLRRAAEREVDLLHEVREHSGILPLKDYVEDAALGPTLLQDAFEGGEPLDALLRRNPDLSLGPRVEILRQVAHTLQHCHSRGVVHGNLHPGAVLVRMQEAGNPEVRLFKFQLGRREASSATQHRSMLQGDSGKLYQAPELFEDPAATRPVSDVFSLGALAYFALTNTEPAPTWLEVQVLLREHGALDPRRVLDTVPDGVAQCVVEATRFSAALRADNAGAWAELLLEAATAPDAPATEEVSPIQARPKDKLVAGRFEVQAVLGRGATSHVLRVSDDEREGRSYALKVSLEERHDERLRAEAGALRRLNDRRIVQCFDELTIGGRTALLLSLAGNRTLQAQLAEEGPVSLDFACRYGEDLLDSLAHLEEVSVPHRDIKPANLGVGASTGRKANHLVLFDFSLVGVPLDELGVGTAVYRDPFLVERKRWDTAGDRWSAAMTLHEMLTGERPRFTGPALDPASQLALTPERFEVAREELLAFFQRALARDAEDRFPSAEAMKRAWSRCFAEDGEQRSKNAKEQQSSASSQAPKGQAAHDASREPGAMREIELNADTPESGARPSQAPVDYTSIAPELPVAQLPLSVRARNGLERAGLIHAQDLLSLPDNHVSAVRGVGRAVAKEILEFRKRWREARALVVADAKAFVEGYAGPNLALTRCAAIEPQLARVLVDGALTTLAQVAAAPAARVEALCLAAEADPAALRAALEAEALRAREEKLPTSLESWLSLLFAGRSKARGYVRALYGLEAPFAGRPDVTGAELGKHFALNPVNIYVAVAKQRDTWATLEALPDLLERCAALLEENAGVLSLVDAARRLLSELPHASTTPEPLLLAQGAAVWRALAEATSATEKLEPTLIVERLDRSDHGSLWIATDAARLNELRRLGRAADELAERPVLASPTEALRVLRETLEPAPVPVSATAIPDTTDGPHSPLAQLPPERLVPLAASASRKAAASAHLEVYPRGMENERALRHSAAILTGELGYEDVQRRVLGRYPEAAPLPEPAQLPALFAQVGLSWDGRSAQLAAARRTQHTTATRYTTLQEPVSEQELAARDFHALVRGAIEQGDVRLFAVPSRHARQAVQKLVREFAPWGLEARSVDHALFDEMQAFAREKSIPLQSLYRADAQGVRGAHWPKLRQVAEHAAERLATRWTAALQAPGAKPLLFVQLGLVARFGLSALLQRITGAETTTASLFLVAGAKNFAVNGDLVIPGVLPGQCSRLSNAWLSANDEQPEARGSSPLQRAGSAS